MNGLIKAALSAYGVTEIPGEDHNTIILGWYDQLGIDISDDETSWCSTFLNWCAMVAGCERTNKLNARSWLDIGEEVKNPVIGDVVVFWRESPESWKGHVGLYVREDADNVYTLGGNQNNMVCVKKYPKQRLLGYRRLHQA